MRRISDILLVFLAVLGLAVPKAGARAHDESCGPASDCSALTATECPDFEPCHDSPPPCQSPCEHPDDSQDDGPQPLHDPPGEHPTPAPKHHHHHHHQCVCSHAGGWLIADGETLSLQPPCHGLLLTTREPMRIPESPVFLLDRPPMA